ncbi:MAG: DUF898 family protein [Paracoccaceae bacterium]
MALTEFQTEYVGTRGRLFRLALTSSLLTVLTLGLYRFWMKTRLRRYYWSAIRPGGQPLEYVGEPMEKLLGFLIAVVILAFYIGIVNLLLMFLSFSLLQGNFAAYALSFVGVIPIMFYARYRARRYILARTRWRGLRFGMAQGAWGYAGRAFLHWSITILTLGLLWPRMTFALEKYRTDRTFFGTGQFVQGGHWQMLYRPFLPLLAGLVIAGIAVVLASWGSVGQAMLVGAVGTVWALYGLAHYRVHSFRLLTNTKSLGEIGFRARPRPWRVIRIYVFGNLIVGLLMSLFLTALLAALGGAVITVAGSSGSFDPMELGANLPVWLSTMAAMLLYFSVFVSWGVFQHVFVTLPLARHYAQTLDLTGTHHLPAFQQRDRDEFTEAEGFAEALDLGAAI